MALNSLDS